VTWNSAGIKGVNATTNPLFMVVEYKAPAGSCSNNMKVYPILPQNAFTVDILNLKYDTKAPLAYATKDNQCYADIASAKFVAPNMVYDYGVNYLYFEVIAANFTGSFTPSFKLTGLHKGQSALVELATDKSLFTSPPTPNPGIVAWGSATTANDNTTPLSFAGTTSVPTDVTNTSVGVAVYVRVTVTNGLYEGLSNDDVILAVEAVNSSNEPDIDNATCAAGAGYEDTATQTLNLRPTVTNDPTTGTFVPQTAP
jgi:hypothetical protein